MTRCIERHADDLVLPGSIDKRRLLAALATVESAGGRNLQPNFEPAFWEGGRYWGPALAEYRNRWETASDPEMRPWCGKAVACSWGPWQVLYVTAAELGYGGPPWGLTDPDTCLSWAIHLINSRIAKQIPPVGPDQTLVWLLADAYNSGSARDRFIPAAYCTKVWASYKDTSAMTNLAYLGPLSDFGK